MGVIPRTGGHPDLWRAIVSRGSLRTKACWKIFQKFSGVVIGEGQALRGPLNLVHHDRPSSRWAFSIPYTYHTPRSRGGPPELELLGDAFFGAGFLGRLLAGEGGGAVSVIYGKSDAQP